MRRIAIAVGAGALLLSACAAGTVGGPSRPVLDTEGSERVSAACAGIVRDLASEVGETERIVSALEDIHAAVGDGLAELRDLAEAAGSALDGDLATSPQARYRVAIELVPLADGLAAAGVGECAELASLAGSIVASGTPGPTQGAAEALADARRRWADRGIDDYTIEIAVGPGEAFADVSCGGDLLIVVVDGVPSTAIDRFGGCVIDPTEADGPPLTVDDLFALVERHLDAAELDVRYDIGFGYPNQVFARGPDGVVDLSVVSFTPDVALSAETILDDLAARRADWAAAGIDDYEMVVQVDCFCPEEYRGPFEVTVVDGEVAAATWNGEPAAEFVDRRFFTVDGLFDVIEGHAYADEIDVDYAPEGFPTRISVDPSRTTMDEELGVRILEFRPAR